MYSWTEWQSICTKRTCQKSLNYPGATVVRACNHFIVKTGSHHLNPIKQERISNRFCDSALGHFCITKCELIKVHKATLSRWTELLQIKILNVKCTSSCVMTSQMLVPVMVEQFCPLNVMVNIKVVVGIFGYPPVHVSASVHTFVVQFAPPSPISQTSHCDPILPEVDNVTHLWKD